MGCTGSRADNPEEEAITFAETGLGFNKNRVENVDYVIGKFSSDEAVSISQFARIAKELSLSTRNYGTHSKIEAFYDAWRDEHGQIRTQELQALGILLSQGETSVKARNLFQCFNKAQVKAMDHEQVQAMIDTLMWISLKTSRLVDNFQTKVSSEPKALKYTQELSSVAQKACDRLVTEMVRQDTLTEEAFVEKTGLGYRGRLTTTGGWRLLALAEFSRQQRRHL